MKTRPVGIQRIDQGIRFTHSRELVALRPNIRTIDEDSIGKLSLKAKRPPLRVWAAKILLDKAPLVIHRAWRFCDGWQLFRPPRRPTACTVAGHTRCTAIWWCRRRAQ